MFLGAIRLLARIFRVFLRDAERDQVGAPLEEFHVSEEVQDSHVGTHDLDTVWPRIWVPESRRHEVEGSAGDSRETICWIIRDITNLEHL